MWRGLRLIVAAWLLLTIIPLPATLRERVAPDDWARCAPAFPLVGIVLAVLLAVVADVGTIVLGLQSGAALTVIAGAILTAGLHLDGFADSADALGARGTGEAQRRRRLEILRDSATGTYGALAIGSVLLLQFALLTNLSVAGLLTLVVALLLAVPLGRTAGVVHAAVLRPARAQGLGAQFAVSRRALLVTLLLALAWVLLVAGLWVVDRKTVGAATGPVGAVAGAALGVLITTRLAARRLSGRTGDTIGATIVVAETLALLGFLAAS